MSTLKPETPEQARDAVRWAISEEAPLEIVGGGTKRGLGRPLQTPHALDLSGLRGILFYEPDELVMGALAGTPLAEIEAAALEKGQELAFEPPELAPLLGAPDHGRTTLGGVIACNLAGPRRVVAGAARDHLLGLEAVSGRGDHFKAGGRVVKNVTGYDLCKLYTGAFGTLGAMTRLTVKVMPRAEAMHTVLVLGLDLPAAVKAMTAALQSPYEVAGACHLPAASAARLDVPGASAAAGSVTAVRVQGFAPSVAYREGRVRALLDGCGPMETLDDPASRAFWQAVRDVRPFVGLGEDRAVWKLSVPPATAAAVVAAVGPVEESRYLCDWGGGLIWLAVKAGRDAAAPAIRAAVGESGGHATLVRAPEPVRAAVEVFHPQPDPLARLAARVKEAFDPKRVLNPGRMYAGV
jgi:glycolate oxidase FAD binding subunit